jgi:hypothetical protein
VQDDESEMEKGLRTPGDRQMTWPTFAIASINGAPPAKPWRASVLPLSTIQTRAFIGQTSDPFLANLGSEILEDVETWVCLRK